VGAFRNVFIALLNLALKTSSAPESHGCGKVTPESLAPSSSPLLHQRRRRLSSLAEFTARPSDSRKDARCSLFRLWTMVFRCGRCFRRGTTAMEKVEKEVPRGHAPKREFLGVDATLLPAKTRYRRYLSVFCAFGAISSSRRKM
jgi:hypothetical protein